ncbi:MAG: hypothetical protein ACK5LL_02190 [Suipraeoptans sp.]
MDDKQTLNDLAAKCASLIKDMSVSKKHASMLARKLSDKVAEILLQDSDDTTHIAAPNAVLEFVNESDGSLYRRYLELETNETANGIRIKGDDISGKPVQIVFLSNTALEQMKDLKGEGLNSPRCDH